MPTEHHFFKFEDPERVGEAVINVLEPEGPTEHGGFTLDDYLVVWSKVFELAGIKAPARLAGWVPVFQPETDSTEDIARAKQLNTFIAEVASLHGSHRYANGYWDDVEDMWKRIQEEKAKQAASV